MNELLETSGQAERVTSSVSEVFAALDRLFDVVVGSNNSLLLEHRTGHQRYMVHKLEGIDERTYVLEWVLSSGSDILIFLSHRQVDDEDFYKGSYFWPQNRLNGQITGITHGNSRSFGEYLKSEFELTPVRAF